MSDDIDAMMAVGLLHTVRECAHRLYGENQTYPCDDVKRMAAENERLGRDYQAARDAHDKLLREVERFKLSLSLTDTVKQTQEQAEEIVRLREALEEIASITVHSSGDIHGISPTAWRAAFGHAHAVARAAIIKGESDG